MIEGICSFCENSSINISYTVSPQKGDIEYGKVWPVTEITEIEGPCACLEKIEEGIKAGLIQKKVEDDYYKDCVRQVESAPEPEDPRIP